MRKLQTTDIFNTMRLIKKVGLKEEIKPVIATAAEGNLSVQDIGIEAMITVFEIVSDKKAEHALYEVLAGPFEMNPEEVGTLELADLLEKVEILAKENDLKRFFTILSGLLKKK